VQGVGNLDFHDTASLLARPAAVVHDTDASSKWCGIDDDDALPGEGVLTPVADRVSEGRGKSTNSRNGKVPPCGLQQLPTCCLPIDVASTRERCQLWPARHPSHARFGSSTGSYRRLSRCSTDSTTCKLSTDRHGFLSTHGTGSYRRFERYNGLLSTGVSGSYRRRHGSLTTDVDRNLSLRQRLR
jgi:hypothetical protein